MRPNHGKPDKPGFYLRGDQLDESARNDALRMFVHRFTGEHVPEWAKTADRNTGLYPALEFISDWDWLTHTQFATTRIGRLDYRQKQCWSDPTWPDGKELRDTHPDAMQLEWWHRAQTKGDAA